MSPVLTGDAISKDPIPTPMSRPWLAHYDYWTPPTIPFPERPLTDILDAAFVDVPDRPATAFLGATLTYGELKAQSDRFAASLVRLGIRKGDRVGIMLPTCPQYIVATFAVLRAGAIVVNINPGSTTRELLAIAGDSGLRLVVTLDALAPGVLALGDRTAIEQVVVTALSDYASDVQADAADRDAPHGDARRLAFADLCEGHGRPPITNIPIDADDVAVLQYTGGTTGTPKAAMLTHRNIFANVVQTEAFTERVRTRGETRTLVVLPFFHIFGFTVGMMKSTWLGALQILIPKFHPATVLEAVRTFAPTYFPAVPTIWTSLVSHPDAASAGLDRVRICTSGAAPLRREVIDHFEALTGRPLFEGFGLTEASPVTHSTPQLGPRKPGTVGLPMPGTDITIVDVETGTRELPAGEAGELCVAGPQVMKGYWQQPEETAEVLRRHADGRVWLHTGDIATIDADGYTTIVQRKKDLIIVDGCNVYPSEVEAVLNLHPAVRMSAAVGVPDEYHGEVVRACVVLHDGRSIESADLLAHCREQLSEYKVPVSVEIRDTLPATAVGKILYRVLREQLISR